MPTYLIVPRSVESCNKTLELLHLQFWQSLGTGDFNNDGNPDLILNNINSNCNTVWLMNETNYAGFANLPTAPAGWQIAGMA